MVHAGDGHGVGQFFALDPKLKFAGLVARVVADLKRGHHDHLGPNQCIRLDQVNGKEDSGGKHRTEEQGFHPALLAGAIPCEGLHTAGQARDPSSSRPRARPPPSVASSSASRAVIHLSARSGSSTPGPSGGRNPSRSRASNIACRVSKSIFEESLLAEPSTPSPILTPHAMDFLIDAMPARSR